jgi:hypothetical protein
MNAPPASYFIYYRVSADRLAVALSSISALQNEVRLATGISGRILCKDDGSNTWMEVYEGVYDCIQFESLLDAALARSGFATLLDDDSHRHVERFVAPRRIKAA